MTRPLGILLLLGTMACTVATESDLHAPAATSDAIDLAPLDPVLTAGTVLLVGELHGTVEAPAVVSRVVAHAIDRGLPVTLGLEIPPDELPRVSAFLASDGNAAARSALLSGPFWQSTYQDGRRSRAMAGLLDDVRRLSRAGKAVRVVLFDGGYGQRATTREPAMTRALVSAVRERDRDVTIVLVGDVHARLARGGVPGMSEPMALRAARMLPNHRFVSLRLSYSGGAAWTCGSGSGGCGEAPVGRDDAGKIGLTLSDEPSRGFHGSLHVGTIHASPPAVVERRVSSRPPSDPVWEEPAAPMPLVASDLPPVPPGSGGEWPRWMGPRGDASTDPGLLPAGATARLELEWLRPVGGGYSSLSVAGERAYTLESDEHDVWMLALEVRDGSEIWRARLADPRQTGKDEKVAKPMSTPATDGERVFATHAAGRLFAFDARDGALLWARDLARDFDAEMPSFGMSSPPLPLDGSVFVLVGGDGGNNLVAFDAETGETRMLGGHAGDGSYATPVRGELRGLRQLVVPAGDRLYAVRPDDGEVIWIHDDLTYPDRDPLLLPGGRVFVPLQEYAAMLEVSEDGSTVRELWRSEPVSNSYSPAVFHDGALYGMGGGSLFCLDPENGRALWKQRVGDAALIRVDDHLVVYGRMSGELRLVRASRRGYAETARTPVFPGGKAGLTPPSFGAGRVFVRGASEIAAVRVVR